MSTYDLFTDAPSDAPVAPPASPPSLIETITDRVTLEAVLADAFLARFPEDTADAAPELQASLSLFDAGQWPGRSSVRGLTLTGQFTRSLDQATLRVARTPQGLLVEGNCSLRGCVAPYCAHTRALVLQLRTLADLAGIRVSAPVDPRTELDRWFDEIDAPFAPLAPSFTHATLLLELAPHSNEAIPQLRMRALLAGAGEPLSAARPLPVGTRALRLAERVGLPEADLERLKRLAASPSLGPTFGEWRRVDTTQSLGWLQDMVQRGQVRYRDGQLAQPPLVHAASTAEPVRATWLEAEDRSQTLIVEPPLPDAQPLNLGRLAWLEPATGRLVWGCEAPETLLKLLRFPVVPTASAPAVADRWANTPTTQHLPPPRKVWGVERRAVTPTAHVRISRGLAHRRGKDGRRIQPAKPAVLVELGFRYDGVLFAADAAAYSVVRNGNTVVYERDELAEQAAAATLRGFLLEATEVGEGFKSRRTWAKLLPPTEIRAEAVLMMERLIAAGLDVDLDPGLNVEFVNADADDGFAALEADPEDARFYHADVGVLIQGQRVSLIAVASRLLAEPSFSLADPDGGGAQRIRSVELPDGRFLRMTEARLRQLLAPLAIVLDPKERPNGPLRLTRSQVFALQLGTERETWGSADLVRPLIAQISEAMANPSEIDPPGVERPLDRNQRQALGWLTALYRFGAGGVYADYMGGGKTAGALALICALKAMGALDGPVLLVVPVSGVSTWLDEAREVTPGLRLLNLTFESERGQLDRLADYDIVMTSYTRLSYDREALRPRAWGLCLADEADVLLNPDNAVRRELAGLKIGMFVPITGTPFNNRLLDLWSLLDLAVPGLLGQRRDFHRTFKQKDPAPGETLSPEDQARNTDRLGRLRRLMSPFILMRDEDELGLQLPPRVEVVHQLELPPGQRALYEPIRAAMHSKVRQALQARGNNAISVFSNLLRMRQAVCHPPLLGEKISKGVPSVKFEHTLTLIDQLRAEGRKVLVYSFFSSVLDLLETELARRAIVTSYIKGPVSSEKRVEEANRFKHGPADVFLITLMSGKSSYNLPQATAVIIFDPWWNEAATTQAMKRAHRRGQTETVKVFHLLSPNTVEDGMVYIRNRKADQAQALFEGGTAANLDALLDAETELRLLFSGQGELDPITETAALAEV